MNKMSTMLGLVFFSSLFFNSNAHADNCSTYSVNEVKSTDKKAIFCVDDRTGKPSVIDVASERRRIMNLKGGSVYTVKTIPEDKLTRKQQRDFGLLSSSGVTPGTPKYDRSGNNNGSGGNGDNGNNGGNNSNGGNNANNANGGNNNNNGGNNSNNNSNVNNNPNNNNNSNSDVRPSRRDRRDARRQDRRDRRNARRGRGGGGGQIYRDDPLAQAQADYDTVKNFCLDLPDMIDKRQDSIEDLDKDIASYNIPALQAAVDAAYKAMLGACRKDCIRKAMNKSDVCYMQPDRLAEVVGVDDLDPNSGLKLDVYLKGQDDNLAIASSHTSIGLDKVCSKMMMKAECKADIAKNGLSDCEEAQTWLAALNDLQSAKTAIADLQSRKDTYAKNSGGRACRIESVADIEGGKWDSCDTKCLETALQGCQAVLTDAQNQINNTMYNKPCPTCGTGPGGIDQNTCMLYGNCGVSKAAQIIAAAGGPVTSLLGGLMQMSMYNRGLTACTAMYSQQIQLSQVVGLPPTGPNCGGIIGGAGFMGGNMMGGNMYNPMMMGGNMYNPMMMGGNMYGNMGQFGPMYNPMMMGGNMYGNMGQFGGMPMGYNPYGNGFGFNAGINLGMPNMYGQMYNPMMYGQGQFNPMMQGNMYGQMYNPMMYNQGNVNMYGQYQQQQYALQAQMYNAQLQMQQNAAQQMAIQNSMMYGYNNAGNMYGLNNMYQSPYYAMGNYNTPGVYSMNYGPNGFPNYGYGQYYNPYGYNTGFNAGVNFNAGLNIWP